jgi:phage gp36-like protein
MADYTNVTLLKQTLPMLNSVTTVQSADLARVITAAESVMNAKLARTYTVPVVPTPPVLETIATDLTLYRLLAMRFYTTEQMNNSVWPDRFKESMELVDKIASGEMPLITASGTTVSATVGNTAMYSSTELYQQTMTEDCPELSSVDPEKIIDTRALR